MGQLYSRVIKRFTQCSQSRNLTQQQADQTSTSQPKPTRPETIPVGESIDSAEYAALVENAANVQQAAAAESQRQQQSQAGKQSTDEEAAIKIQATWRGHAARKALRGGQSLSVPAPLPLASGSQRETTTGAASATPSPRLESIAEDAETPPPPPPTTSDQRPPPTEGGLREKRKLSPLATRSTSSPAAPQVSDQLASPSANTRGSMSPALSEAAASIDLNCDMLASASIDIVDHLAKVPAEMMATVLHTRSERQVQQETALARPEARGSVDLTSSEQQAEPEPLAEEHHEQEAQQQYQQDNTTTNGHSQRVTVTTSLPDGRASDSLESEEVAAIRIQSAFRGYRTRKNSPYRNRSPNQQHQVDAELASNGLGEPEAEPSSSAADTLAASVASEQADSSSEADARRKASLQPQKAIEELTTSQEEERQAELAGRLVGERRQSRSRHRGSGEMEGLELELGTEVAGQGGKEGVAIRGAPSMEEFTTTETESTVKQVEQQVGALVEAQQSTVDEAASLAISELSDQLQSVGAALEQDSSAAVPGDETNSSWAPERQQDVPRPSLGGRSEISLELDTDSSNLGAVVSMRDEDSSGGAALETDKSEVATNVASLPTDFELETVARRLVEDGEELSTGAQEKEPPSSAALDESEQREFELNSDDIERRDPRGQVSEERAKSPLVRTEPPTLSSQQSVESSASGEASPPGLLTPPIADQDQQSTSGRSSGCGSSAEDEENEGLEQSGDKTEEGQQRAGSSSAAAAAGSGGRNRKRNNRNKRKGNKK